MKSSSYTLLLLLLSLSVALVNLKRNAVSLYAISLSSAFISYDLMNAPVVSEKPHTQSLDVTIDKANNNWVEQCNQKSAEVSSCYIKQPLFPASGQPVKGKEAITRFFNQPYPCLSKVKLGQVDKHFIEMPTLIHETGTLITDKKKKYSYTVKWNGNRYCKLEAVTENTTSQKNMDAILQCPRT